MKPIHSLTAAAAPEPGEPFDIVSYIMHHLADSPYWDSPFGKIHFPQFPPIQAGPFSIDLSITKHVFFMFVAATIAAVLLIRAGRKAAAAQAAGAERGPQGASNVVEAIVLFIRDEIAMKNIGHGGERYVPFIVTIFFFIWICNTLGLLPWGETATGNISVTATLAVMTFVVVEVAGMRALGWKGYLRTIFYAPPGLHPAIAVPMYVIMTPVEFIGKLAKPFALAVRLFANMTAGHAVVLALAGLMVSAQLALGVTWGVAVGLPAIVMATLIMVLKIFVSLLQAYIFAMLASVFIGLIRHAH